MRYRFCVISLITIFFTFVMCPFIKTQSFVYADSVTDQWQDVTTNQELADAFRYYCKSRNLTIDGSITDGITSFTTSTFTNICNTLGIDMTALQANLKKSTDSNGRLQFLFDSSGISTYNRIFAEFLQNNDLAVGDTADETNNTIYSGKWFIDSDNNGCLIFISSTLPFSNTWDQNYIIQYGTPYIYDSESASSHVNSTIIFNHFNLSYPVYSVDLVGRYQSGNIIGLSNNVNTAYNNQGFKSTNFVLNSTNRSIYGYPCISYNSLDGNYYLCVYQKTDDPTNNRVGESLYTLSRVDLSNNVEDSNIYLTTNNTTINNNNYEGDTIINNEGDTGGDSGGGDSGGGDSGGGESGGDTNIDIDFPDFNFPNIPNIDFNLGDLSHKFPFSIPFDLVAFFTVLNADPVAPSIDSTIPLPDPIADWHFEADFSQFDNYAVIIRNVEYIGFVIGLIYLTVRFVKG